MSKITLRLRIPDGRPGETIEVDDDRAAALVNAKYAVYADEPEPESNLPAASDLKEAWVEAAGRYGVEVDDEDGKPKTKDVLIDEVTQVAGG